MATMISALSKDVASSSDMKAGDVRDEFFGGT